VNKNDQRVVAKAKRLVVESAADLQKRLQSAPESARGEAFWLYLQNCVDLAQKEINAGRYYAAALNLEAAAVAIREADPDRAQPHHLKAQSG
jgi:plasmid maintenance system antidote protein VapI